MNVPFYVRHKPIRENLPVLADELTKVTRREMDRIARFVGKELVAQINENKDVVRVRIK